MLKKLLIAAVAVIAGMTVLTKMTNISLKTWFGDCCRSVRHMVPPEVQLKQLKADIDNIDKEIDKNLGALARMAAEVDQFGEDLDRNRNRQAHLRADISDMKKGLEEQTAKVMFRGRKFNADDLTLKLERAVTEYNCLKEKVKLQERIFAEKKRALAAAKEKITAMKNEQERLRVLAVRLEHDLELVRMKQIQNQAIDFDNSALSRAQQNAKDVEARLREIEHRIEYMKEFGRTDATTLEPIKGKSREEVLHAAKAALQDDSKVNVAIDNEENDQ
jgi:chromosome segregation ATPase